MLDVSAHCHYYSCRETNTATAAMPHLQLLKILNCKQIKKRPCSTFSNTEIRYQLKTSTACILGKKQVQVAITVTHRYLVLISNTNFHTIPWYNWRELHQLMCIKHRPVVVVVATGVVVVVTGSTTTNKLIHTSHYIISLKVT